MWEAQDGASAAKREQPRSQRLPNPTKPVTTLSADRNVQENWMHGGLGLSEGIQELESLIIYSSMLSHLQEIMHGFHVYVNGGQGNAERCQEPHSA